MIHLSQKSGLTIIEMVALIVLVGTAIPPLMTMWADTAWRSGKAESSADAGFYAQELMEEIKTKAYDENKLDDTGPPWSSSLGANSESYPNFDDVDDYNNYSDVPTPGYNRQVAVSYVRLNGTNWTACGAGSCAAVVDCSACDQCCYKRATVSVSRNDNVVSNVSLTTIVSGH
ncbi:MAG: hypothetical protein AABZ65_01085 [Candidatus Omnitrophota bacterium]